MVSQVIRYKKQIIRFILIVLFITGIYMAVDNNYRLYDKPIGTVINEGSEVVKTVKGKNNKEEIYYSQNLTLKIRNTELIGRKVEIINEYTLSQIDTTKYKKGDDLFLNIKEEKDGVLKGSISEVKRDKYTILLLILFAVIMVMATGKRGLLTLVTLTVNVLIFFAMIHAYVNKQDLDNMLFLISGIFAALTLFILGGIKKKSVASVISTIITVWIVMGIYHIVYNLSDELPYEMMEYISGPDFLEPIFRGGIILGCLGAVMDIAITINSSVHELVETTPSINLKEIYRSVSEIGHDIRGTMINVLFFTFASGCIPMAIIKIDNGYSLLSIIQYSIVFDTIRFLMGAIGIVLAIPISSFIAVLFVMKRLVKKNAV